MKVKLIRADISNAKELHTMQIKAFQELLEKYQDFDTNPANENVEFVISSECKKIIYAPCDIKPFPKSEKFQDADVLIIGNTIVGDVLKDRFVLNDDNPLKKELFALDEIDALRKQYGIKEVIITHLEEDWENPMTIIKNWRKN